MLTRTHLAISFLFVILLLDFVNEKVLGIFVIGVFIGTLIPDLDNKFSKVGRKKMFRPIQFFIKHREGFHSLLFLFLLTIVSFLIFNKVFYGFILGFSLHLLADCFTKRGLTVFYPLKIKIKGFVKSGGKIESLIFISSVVIGFSLLIPRFSLIL